MAAIGWSFAAQIAAGLGRTVPLIARPRVARPAGLTALRGPQRCEVLEGLSRQVTEVGDLADRPGQVRDGQDGCFEGGAGAPADQSDIVLGRDLQDVDEGIERVAVLGDQKQITIADLFGGEAWGDATASQQL